GVDVGEAKGFEYAETSHDVTVAPFYLDRLEVSVGALRAAGGPALDGADDLPARNLTWDQARDACAAMGKRLPTATEWERAAVADPHDPEKAQLRAGRHTPAPARVGAHPGDCTGAGVCDLLGNVMEWTADAWPDDDSKKVVRGASYRVAPDAGWYASVHARLPVAPATADPEIGFRCAADLPKP
ncbi:MAG: SUMF1/EgtB/PvdO family nonheme iron enzyme, partial [Myxococcales bacterium]|nr:SUMF1/EgtB/PvdO family nonheme iron enzyme [Myxococcales bacterium]